MGDKWQYMPFSEAVVVNPSVSLKRGETYPYVDMQAVDPSRPTVGPSRLREFAGGGSRFEPYDTLMARITPCLENGKIARYVPDDEYFGPAFGSTEFIVIRGKEGVTDNDFVFYLTRWREFRSFAIAQMTGSSGRQRVPAESLAGFEVPVPPLPEQRAIARILGTLDDKIELNRRMNETLEAMAQALFKSWFVDLDPVVVNALRAGNPIPEKFAERAAHYRDNLDALGLPEDILRLFPDRFVDSELGPIPEGWEVKQVREFAALKGGQQLSKKYIKDHGPVPVFGGAGIMGYTTISNATGFVITVGRVGAYCGQFFRHIGEAWINNNASLVRVHERKLGEWLYLALRNANIDVIKKGAAQPFVANSDIECLPILWPGSNLASKLSEFVSKMRALQDHYVVESRTLAALRDTLLPKLISGELRVKDVEKILEDAV